MLAGSVVSFHHPLTRYTEEHEKGKESLTTGSATYHLVQALILGQVLVRPPRLGEVIVPARRFEGVRVRKNE